MYFRHESLSIASYYRNGGSVELVYKVGSIQNNFDKVLITNSPDDQYPWYAYFNNVPVVDFNRSIKNTISGVHQFNNIIFTGDKCPSSRVIENKLKVVDKELFVDAEGCVIDKLASGQYQINQIGVINRPDGSTPFILREIKSK